MQLEHDIIETLIAGHKEWRPDLNYPESHSDMQGAVRALLRMFEVKRRPIAVALKYNCPDCEGLGRLVTKIEPGIKYTDTCPTCKGKRRFDLE